MQDTLVAVAPDKDDLENGAARAVFGGMRNYTFPLEGGEFDIDRGHWQRDVKQWICYEADVPHVAAELTKNNPGRDIHVYKLTTVYYRVPGEMQSKTVTKDGILPNLA